MIEKYIQKCSTLEDTKKLAYKFADLVKEGLQIKSVNIGGMHFKENAQKLAEHVFLDANDKRLLKLISDLGISVETRAVPNGVSISIREVLL